MTAQSTTVRRLRQVLHAGVFLVAPLFLPLMAAGDEVPELILNLDGKPYWVSANQALDRNKRLKPGVLGDYGWRAEGRLHRNNEHGAHANAQQTDSSPLPPELMGCRSFSVDVPEHSNPTSSLSDLVQNADVIVSARIVAIQQGFLSGGAGSLLLLDAEYLKGEPTLETYLFYPLARIATAEGLLCSKPLHHFIPPKVGDRLLVFSMFDPVRISGQTILYVDPSRELVQDSKGTGLVTPPAFASSFLPAAAGFNDIKIAVAKALDAARAR
jgi:hypothetical protein